MKQFLTLQKLPERTSCRVSDTQPKLGYRAFARYRAKCCFLGQGFILDGQSAASGQQSTARSRYCRNAAIVDEGHERTSHAVHVDTGAHCAMHAMLKQQFSSPNRVILHYRHIDKDIIKFVPPLTTFSSWPQVTYGTTHDGSACSNLPWRARHMQLQSSA